MQGATLGGQILHGPQGQAVDRVREADAAVDGTPGQGPWCALGRWLGDHHGAGAAVALAAALFGAAGVQVFPQQVQQGAVGWHPVQGDGFAAADKSEGLGVHDASMAGSGRHSHPDSPEGMSLAWGIGRTTRVSVGWAPPPAV